MPELQEDTTIASDRKISALHNDQVKPTDLVKPLVQRAHEEGNDLSLRTICCALPPVSRHIYCLTLLGSGFCSGYKCWRKMPSGNGLPNTP